MCSKCYRAHEAVQSHCRDLSPAETVVTSAKIAHEQKVQSGQRKVFLAVRTSERFRQKIFPACFAFGLRS